MAELAIRGNISFGWKVIEILEMLGGRTAGYSGLGSQYYYYIDECGNITGTTELSNCETFVTYTLEEFREKFPYEVGYRVRVPEYESEVCISKMYWDGNEVQYEVVTDEVEWYSAKELNEFNDPNKVETFGECIEKTINECLFGKEETGEEKGDKAKAPILIGEDYSGKRFGYKIPNGYVFDCIKNNEIILKPKQPQYPKTYEECCKIMGFNKNILLKYHNPDVERGNTYLTKEKILLDSFLRLRICRNAYWKIAGEQMGLGKPWEPKWEIDNVKYSILVVENEIRIGDNEEIQRLLVFPTAEMRDTFFNNFKELIEECKEFL